MKYHRFLAILFFISHSVFGNDSLDCSTFQKRHIQQILECNKILGKIVSKAFTVFQHTAKHDSTSAILHNQQIKDLFLLTVHRSEHEQLHDSLQGVQKLMLIYVYNKIFKDCISQTQYLMEDLLCSLDYWREEMFYDQLPMIKKNPGYWMRSVADRKLVRRRVEVLTQVEHDVATFLGIALHGRFKLTNFAHEDELSDHLMQAIEPLYQQFCAPMNVAELNNANSVNTAQLFEDALWLYESMQNTLKVCRNTIQDHQKPHHVVRHQFLYGCLAVGVVAGYVVYKKYEDKIPDYQKKGNEAVSNFVNDFVKAPLHNIKEALWDNKSKEIKKLDMPKPASHVVLLKRNVDGSGGIKEFDMPESVSHIGAPESFNNMKNISRVGITVWGFGVPGAGDLKDNINTKIDELNMVGNVAKGVVKEGVDVLNKKLDEFNKKEQALYRDINIKIQETNILAQEIENDANQKIDEFNQARELLYKEVNIKIGELNEIMKTQQLTLYIATIVPACLLAYGSYRAVLSLYNSHVKHEAWYRPMKLLVRAINKELNALMNESKRSYAGDGKVHVLALRLKSFMYCLDNEELQLFQDDMQQLLAYDLSYAQKKDALKHMYHTYEFLK